MIVTSRTVVIGSANASDTSARRHETAVVSTDPALVDAAWDSIDTIGNLTVVDDMFIDTARRTWDRGRVGPRHRPVAEPDWSGRFWGTTVESYDMSDTELDAWNHAARSARRTDDSTRIGDIVVSVDDDHLDPPNIVIDEPIRTGRRHDQLFITRHRTDHEPIPIDHATRQLDAAGVHLGTRQVRSKAARAAILDLWDTTS